MAIDPRLGRGPRLGRERTKRARVLADVVFGGHTSYDVKIHFIYTHLFVGLPLSECARNFGKPESTCSDWVKKFREKKEGGLMRKEGGNSHRKIFEHHKVWIERYVKKRPLSYLNEIQKAFKFSFFSLSTTTVFRILVERGITNRVIENRALEIQEEDIIRFVLEVNGLAPILDQQIVFLDEASLDNRGMVRKRGWFKRGEIPIARGSNGRTERISILSFIGVSGLLDTDSVDATFTRIEFFNSIVSFLDKGIVEPYPGKNSLWIMDGAMIHLDEAMMDYLFSRGVVVIFLPAYCPFYNPIELFFGLVKAHCKKKYGKRGTETKVLMEVLRDLKDVDMSNIFRKCGYVNGKFDPFVNYPSLK
jgi:transposase